MAKRPVGKNSSRVAVSKHRQGSLFTPAERSLLDLSTADALAKAALAGVKETLGRMRAARDKWRSLAAEQDRGAKRSPRAVSQANARSRDKAEVFAGAVKRLEAHLAEGGSGKETPVAARGRKTPKKRRTAAHRTSRAGLRATLSRAAAMLNESVAKPAAAAVRKAAAAAASTATAAKARVVDRAGGPAGTSAKQTESAPAVRSRSSRKAKKPLVPAASQGVRFDAAKQRSLRTAAKHSRIAVGGLSTRRMSHVVASGKRAQARRDKRR